MKRIEKITREIELVLISIILASWTAWDKSTERKEH